ncbi:hypothetical protein DSLASN_06850 [Desulfoluna limicola]|uniref:Serine aminopeptidase S33 domain-containing protein n=1 Tax=Desulfoluna limicola TaxID=2810562 RepID=A0ABM7PCY8_9BACT|nr:alpha/beta hydrolase [Desulfoluna limicola]BCS95053.1 hypothetical protein DSLASN_06850 [Desulfoluna limicola]
MNRRTPCIILFLFFITGCANGLFYHPDDRLYQTPAIPYEEVTFESLDGTRLSGWFVPATGQSPEGTIIHFHGNAANISNHYGFVDWIPEAGFNLFTFDYRGYGDSEGRPGRHGVFEDSVAALRYVAARSDVNPDRLIALGQSLGGANAVAAAAATPDVPLKGVVVDSAFYSYRSIARDKIGLIPVLGWLKWPLSFIAVTNGHSPGPVIGTLSPTPVLLIHGTHDRVIPYEQGYRLYEAAEAPKALWTVEGGHHTDALITHKAIYRNKLARHLRKCLEGQESLE